MSTCSCQLSCSSKITPRNPLCATLSIVCSRMTISGFESIWFNVFLDPGCPRMSFHSRKYLCHVFANTEAFGDVKQFGKSLIYTKKSNGPIMILAGLRR